MADVASVQDMQKVARAECRRIGGDGGMSTLRNVARRSRATLSGSSEKQINDGERIKKYHDNGSDKFSSSDDARARETEH